MEPSKYIWRINFITVVIWRFFLAAYSQISSVLSLFSCRSCPDTSSMISLPRESGFTVKTSKSWQWHSLFEFSWSDFVVGGSGVVLMRRVHRAETPQSHLCTVWIRTEIMLKSCSVRIGLQIPWSLVGLEFYELGKINCEGQEPLVEGFTQSKLLQTVNGANLLPSPQVRGPAEDKKKTRREAHRRGCSCSPSARGANVSF